MTSQTIEQPAGDSSIEKEPVGVTDRSSGCSAAESSDLPLEFGRDFVWLQRFPNPVRHPLSAITWICRSLMGLAMLLVILTLAASVPLLNFMALGYLLESEGQVARSGKIRHAAILVPAAMRIGQIVVCVILCLVPVMLLANVAADARLIAPQGMLSWFWLVALALVSIAVATHIVFALARGGSLGCFLRPIRNIRWLRQQLRSGDYWRRSDRALSAFLGAVRPWHFFWVGVRGFFTTWIWLALPTVLFGVWWNVGSPLLRTLLLVAGGVCLIPVLAWLPFLQVRLAVENRWGAMFEVRRTRELFRHAPLSWLVATAALYSLSIPLFLYSLQFRMRVPLHITFWWDLCFISIGCSIPARVLLGWAYHRATVRGPGWTGWVWLSRLILGGSLGLYLWLLFHTPLTHESSPWQLEHHPLTLPIPL